MLRLDLTFILVQTSTPASSFIEKSSTPESVSRPSKFQRTRMLRAGSSDSIDVIDEQQNQNLLYRCPSARRLSKQNSNWFVVYEYDLYLMHGCLISALMATDPQELRLSQRDLMLNRC